MTLDIFAINTPEWMNDPARACALPADYDANLVRVAADEWFPTTVQERQATKKCRPCPSAIKNACLAYALERPELEGVWGQTTTAQREMLRGEAGAA